MLSSRNRPHGPRNLVRTLCLLAWGLAATPALAQAATTEPTPAQVQYRKAFEAMRDKDWVEARRLLLDLWDQARTYDVAATLGQVEYQLQNYAAGARYMSFAISNVPPMEKPETVARFRVALDELKTRVGTVKIQVLPASANVLVDGAALDPIEQQQVFLNPGAHTFEAREKGGNATAKTIDVTAGGTYAVSLHVAAPPLALNEPSGAPPPSTAPVADAAAAPAAAEGQERSLVPIYVGAGVTAVSTTIAIVFGVNAASDNKDLEHYRAITGPNGCADGTADPEVCASADAAYHRQRRNATISNVALGVSIGAAAGTLAYYFFWPKKSAATTASLRPLVAIDVLGGTRGTLGLEGTF
jgi:hypothetical protein